MSVWLCHQLNSFSFVWIFLKLADKVDRDEFSDNFQTWPDQIFNLRVMSRWLRKKPLFDIVNRTRSVLVKSFWNLQIVWTVKTGQIKYNQIQIKYKSSIVLTVSRLQGYSTPKFDSCYSLKIVHTWLISIKLLLQFSSDWVETWCAIRPWDGIGVYHFKVTVHQVFMELSLFSKDFSDVTWFPDNYSNSFRFSGQ